MTLISVTGKLVEYLWGPLMIIFCFGLAAYYSFVLKFPQIKHIGGMVKSLSKGQASQSGITPFQSFAMALGGRVGVGSIAGVATAIAYGGPGSVFWMWIYAIFGTASAFGEAVLAQIWKEEVNGEYRGGPTYYLKKCPGPLKVLGILSALCGILGYGFTGPAIQAFNIADSFKTAFGVETWVTGLIVVIIFAVVVIGGMKRIGKFAELIVPFMAGLYLLITLVILIFHAASIPAMFSLIFKSAFNMEAAFGGMFGSAIIWGVKRGVWSSEAGMGSGANAAAAAEVSHPVKQGLAQAFSVYCTTIVCTCTALMILVTDAYNVFGPNGGIILENLPGIEAGSAFTQAAIDTIAPGHNLGSIFVAIAIFLFALTTLFSFGFYAQVSVAFIFQKSKRLKSITLIITFIQLFAIFFGSIKSADLIWNFCDIGIGGLTWLNVLGMLFLLKPVSAALKDYEKQKAQGLDPVFVPSKCNIDGADLWDTIIKEKYTNTNTTE